MDETEKRRMRNMKSAAVKELTALVSSSPHLEKIRHTDERIVSYLLSVSNDAERHNLYEILAAVRFFRLLDKYTWRADCVQFFFRFYEALRFNGTQGRTSYRLTPIQCFQFANIFGFYDDGRRLCRTAYIFVPRKFSKTTSAASLAVYDMLFGDSNAQAYIGANSYEQAKICFDEIRCIMRDIDPSESCFRINREKITFRNGERDSLIRCLTANAKTQDGLFASLVIMDEYAQARNTAGKNGADLRNVLTTSMGPREAPLLVIITTASEVVDGPFAHELEGVKKVLRGETVNDSIFASLFMPDVDDDEGDPQTWEKVQPHLGITVRPDFYKREWENAQLSSENMLAFRTKLLNVFTVNDRKTWFTFDRAQSLLGTFDIDRVEGKPLCAVAFDLSVHDDFSAVSYTIYDRKQKHFFCHTDYYFPRGALSGHPNQKIYEAWAESGHLHLCTGDKIDVKQIATDILTRSKLLSIVRIGYDAYKAQDLVGYLASVGASTILQPYSQTYDSFNLPVESFELLAYDGPPRITLNNNPINAFCLSNCIIDVDRMENKKPIKISQYRKIDGVITMLMTLGQLYRYEM